MSNIENPEKLLLCTDLDRTLIPNGFEPESKDSLKFFQQLVNHPQVTLVYVTGRDQDLVLQAIEDYSLPTPDFVVANVGTSIYKISGKRWIYLEQWEKYISDSWQGKVASQIEEILINIDHLSLQEASKQNTYKLSYYVPLNTDYNTIIKNIKNILDTHSVIANLVWSEDEQADIGLLDILPANAGKRQAIEFLINYLDFNYSNTIFSGDSGNDICVMSSPIQSILVANANIKVKQAAIESATNNNQIDTLYFAKGDYLNMNGNYSAGILEGIAYYMPQVERLFRS